MRHEETTMTATAHDIDRLFARQDAHQHRVRATSAEQRIAKLQALRAAIVAHLPAAVAAMAADFGKPGFEAACEVAALLRFARAPWFQDGEPRTAGDLRYDHEPELGFAELALAQPPRCPAYVPPWTPPRADLLR